MHATTFTFIAAMATAAMAGTTSPYAALGLPDPSDPNYGMKAMAWLKQEKTRTHEEMSSRGAYDLNRYEALNGTQACSNGKAGEYSCKGYDLVGFIRHQDFGSKTRKGNDVWGWTSDDGREFVIVCETDGTGFAELLKDGSMVPLARLPTASSSALWRDAKVIGHHAYIVADVGSHGMQVFDMKKLMTMKHGDPVKQLSKEDLTSHFTGWGNCHNIVANPATNTVFCSGGNTCSGKLQAVDVSDPANLKDLKCVGTNSYSHDAHCTMYNGPDAKYKGKEVCFSFNEKQFVITDITNRASPKELAVMKYTGVAYTHQGWLTKDHKYILMGDEMDERMPLKDNKAGTTQTYIVDVSDLANPKVTGVYFSPLKAIDHNLYIIDDLAYMSNYNTGLRVVDISSINSDPTGKGFKEVAYFDVYPEDDNKSQLGFVGAWSVYPFFKSGYILVNSIERGIMALKKSA